MIAINAHVAQAAMELARLSGYAALARRLRRDTGCLMTFHRAAPSSTWLNLVDRDYYVNASFLERLIDYLLHAGYEIVTLDEVLIRLHTGRKGRYVNFSIDDVYRDTWELIVPIFRRRGVPVTLFVTSGIPDGKMSLWYAGLETIISTEHRLRLPGGSTADINDLAAKRSLFHSLIAKWATIDAAAAFEDVCHLNNYSPAQLHDRHAITWSMLEELSRDPHVEIGGHSVTHPRLSALSTEEARREITECRQRLQSRLGLPIRHFAYPYGRKLDCDQRHFELARLAGYETASTTRKGLVSPNNVNDLHALPRNTINGSHQRTSQIETHLSGLSGLAASLLRAT